MAKRALILGAIFPIITVRIGGIAGYEIKKEEMGTIPVLMLLFKEGRTAMIRGLNKFATILAPEGQIHYAMPGIMSADRQRSQALTRKQLREGSISGLKKMKAKAMTGIGNKVLGKWMKNFILNNSMLNFEIETNGTIEPIELPTNKLQYNVSPKLANSFNKLENRYIPSVLNKFKQKN
ncbi:hypothetical protein LCGC14_3167730 [marine sediment metagenome]|uniref:Uncharacterized protein n=1 Tax=marine sediment metagenome TaxID=412755 RepID=A0A0F8Y6X3_9ZZZZ